MADATWTKQEGSVKTRTRIATINLTDVKTEVLTVDPLARETTIFINVGSGETAIQIKGHNKIGANEALMQVLMGASAISADYDNIFSLGVSAIQITGATTANDTVITVKEVF